MLGLTLLQTGAQCPVLIPPVILSPRPVRAAAAPHSPPLKILTEVSPIQKEKRGDFIPNYSRKVLSLDLIFLVHKLHLS